MLGLYRITESQHGRGWQGPLWVTQSNPLPKQDHPEQAAQDLVQAGLEYLQRRRLYNLPGQPVPGLRHPQREEVLPHVQVELLCFSLCPLPLVLSLGTTATYMLSIYIGHSITTEKQVVKSVAECVSLQCDTA